MIVVCSHWYVVRHTKLFHPTKREGYVVLLTPFEFRGIRRLDHRLESSVSKPFDIRVMANMANPAATQRKHVQARSMLSKANNQTKALRPYEPVWLVRNCVYDRGRITSTASAFSFIEMKSLFGSSATDLSTVY